MRYAREAAGLSLRDVAGDDVSRTLIHFIEHGQTRPSRNVLELIAERTGKPVSYFTIPDVVPQKHAEPGDSLARDLGRIASRVRRYAAETQLTIPERESMRLVEVTLRQAATLARSLEAKPRRRRRKADRQRI